MHLGDPSIGSPMSDDRSSSFEGWRSRLISSAEISALCKKPSEWFSRDRVRKALYERGFPKAVIRGRWSGGAVLAWLENEGKGSESS